jgi:hypothetical protein
MILADALMEHLEQHARLTDRDYYEIQLAVLQAHRFTLSPATQEQVEHLISGRADVLLSERNTAFLPAPLTWIEWEHLGRANEAVPKTGFLLIGGHGIDIHAGVMMVVFRPAGARHVFTMNGGFSLQDNPPFFDTNTEEDRKRFDEHLALWKKQRPDAARQHPGLDPKIYEECGIALLAILSLINSPRATHTQPGADLTKLNRARLRNGRTPFLTWRKVVLNIDDEEASRAARRMSESGRAPLQFVRAHLQRYCGEWQQVAPYYRGDAAFGRVIKSYAAVRKGEKPDRPAPTKQITKISPLS